MHDMPAVMSSKTQDWETPQWLFDVLNREFQFDIDACASEQNNKCKNYFDKDDNSLLKEWSGNIYCNPPYGNELKFFVQKAYEQYLLNIDRGLDNTIVMLVPARPDTKYWHKYILGKAEIRFIKGRLKFELDGVQASTAPFPSAILVYGANAIVSKIETMPNRA